MHLIIGLSDWYTPPNLDMDTGRLAAEAREVLADRFPEVRLYEFLPVATLEVNDLPEAAKALEVPGVEFVLQATSAMDAPGASAYYDRMLSALSAIRSESAYQRYEWHTAAHRGVVFPNEDWTGGVWPAGPYPTVDLSGRLLREDPGVRRHAPPAQISVLSLSMGPANRLPSEPNDPVAMSLAVMSSSHLLVVAAGNHGPEKRTMNPWAVGPSVLSVGAIDDTGRIWHRSSRGDSENDNGPDVVANGVVPGDIGTSYAAPRVAILGAFCAALLSSLNVALSQAQGLVAGVPLEAIAIIDVTPETLEVELSQVIPYVGIPALPLVGLNHNLAVDAFRTVLPAFIEAHGSGEGLVQLPIAPQQIAELICATARPLADAASWEQGFGLVDAEGVVEYFSSVSIGETLRWLGFDAKSLGSSGAKPAFGRDGLEILMETVRLTRPVYVRDVLRGRFARAAEMKTARGDLQDLRSLVLSRDGTIEGHVRRIVSATIV